jgi:hypothetical protein
VPSRPSHSPTTGDHRLRRSGLSDRPRRLRDRRAHASSATACRDLRLALLFSVGREVEALEPGWMNTCRVLSEGRLARVDVSVQACHDWRAVVQADPLRWDVAVNAGLAAEEVAQPREAVEVDHEDDIAEAGCKLGRLRGSRCARRAGIRAKRFGRGAAPRGGPSPGRRAECRDSRASSRSPPGDLPATSGFRDLRPRRIGAVRVGTSAAGGPCRAGFSRPSA